ncbi:hypothetical protein [Duganella callida]|uniref:Chemotaxis methyl-accepting receptor HlyB-like 4HB MCP domain-containing protein n=1 Tax=Duganella callida TaxID=2561932 RepID=A0A4Y9S2Y9_9BURK|nr:hypothetical protein [Duganella callida]TFW13878.1 hypothetical protein E4L98_28140 [Duganella callida]
MNTFLATGRPFLMVFAAQVLLLAVIAGYALSRIDRLERSVTDIAAVNQREFALASDMKDAVSERFRVMERLISQKPVAGALSNIVEIDIADQLSLNSEAELASSFTAAQAAPEELQTLQQARALHEQAAQATRRLLNQLSAGDLDGARRTQQTVVAPLLRQWRDALTRMEKIQLNQNAELVEATSHAVWRARWVLQVLSAFGLLVSAALAWHLTRDAPAPCAPPCRLNNSSCA